MILKKEEECNMSHVFIEKCQKVLPNCDWKLKEKTKDTMNATSIYYHLLKN